MSPRTPFDRMPVIGAGQPKPEKLHLDDIVMIAAKSMFDGPDEEWDALDTDTREQFMSAALKVLMLHDEWLTSKGYRIVPPNTVPVPREPEEAIAMIRVAKAYMEDPKRKRKKILMPAGPIVGRTQ